MFVVVHIVYRGVTVTQLFSREVYTVHRVYDRAHIGR